MERGDKVVLAVGIASHGERRPLIPAGTKGEVIATRKQEDDPEPLALVKFSGWGTPRSVEQWRLDIES